MDKIDNMGIKILGRDGEGLAVAFLEKKGHRILERNFKTKIGEIDLVTEKDNCICFVEVKTRRSFKFGLPCDAVHYRKQHKLIRLAQCYLKYRFNSLDINSRFDVISIYQDPAGQAHIDHVPHAFWIQP